MQSLLSELLNNLHFVGTEVKIFSENTLTSGSLALGMSSSWNDDESRYPDSPPHLREQLPRLHLRNHYKLLSCILH